MNYADHRTAGGTAGEPSDQLMVVPVRTCPVTDPFGVDGLIVGVVGT